MVRQNTILSALLIGALVPLVMILSQEFFPYLWLSSDSLSVIYPELCRLFCPIVVPMFPVLAERPRAMLQFIILLGGAAVVNGATYGLLAYIGTIKSNWRVAPQAVVGIIVFVYWVWVVVSSWGILASKFTG